MKPEIYVGDLARASKLDLTWLYGRSHLERAGATENSARTVIRCREFRPCKRVDCDSCMERRRSYFVEAGTFLANSKGMNWHLTISWLKDDGEHPWEILLNLSSMLSKRMTGRIGPYIRALSIGDSDTPHVHYLISADFVNRFYKIAKSNSGTQKSVIFTDSRRAYDVKGLLDYFFNMNFTPTSNDPRKVKGIRLLSGSRGPITYSYPKTKHWKMLNRMKSAVDEIQYEK